MDLVAVLGGAVSVADENSETGFLEYVDVVVVGVSHGPTTSVSSRLLTLLGVDKLTVSVWPLLVQIGVYIL